EQPLVQGDTEVDHAQYEHDQQHGDDRELDGCRTPVALPHPGQHLSPSKCIGCAACATVRRPRRPVMAGSVRPATPCLGGGCCHVCCPGLDCGSLCLHH